MEEGLNPYAPPVDTGQLLVPGFYACDMRRLSLHEIWRMSPKWAYPLAVVLVKLGRLNTGHYVYLPSTPSSEQCPEAEVPDIVRDRLAPLIKQAVAEGFSAHMWGLERQSLQLKGTLLCGGVHLFNGRDIACNLTSATGETQGRQIDKILVSFGSIARDTGLHLATKTEDKSFDHHPEVRTRVVPRAGFARLLHAHRERLHGDCTISAADYFHRLDAISTENWETRVRRGLFRRLANTREELTVLVGKGRSA